VKKINNPWTQIVLIRKITQWLVLAFFFVLLFFFQHKLGAAPVAGLFFMIDPLISAGVMIASRSIVPILLLALIVVALTIAFGRVWCGWLCPMGTILDLFRARKWGKNAKERTLPLSLKYENRLRNVKYVLLVVMAGAAVFGNLTLFFFDPITLVTRFYAVTLLPVVNTVVTSITGSMYQAGFLTDVVDAVEGVVRGNILPSRIGIIDGAVITGVIFIAIVVLNLVRHRFFCRYLCPLGGLLGLVSRFALFRRNVKDSCKGCLACEKSCTLGIIDKDAGYASDPKECIVCFDCFPTCSKGSVAYSLVTKPAPKMEYDPGRRTLIAGIGAAAIGTALLAADPKKLFADDHLLRPPGCVDEARFLSACTRCGECINACPTSGLVLSLGQGGWGGVFAPRLVPRSGACDYSCNACGTVCAQNAIPKLDLEAKRKTVIGKAFIDRSKCIAWANNDFCAVCSEFCPVRPKSIELVRENRMDPRSGKLVEVPIPYVLVENCIGCGTCENGCPVSGQSAIRVKRV
jgi:polyferredoxin